MKTKNILIVVSASLAFIVSTHTFAEYDDDAYKKRVALSKQIKAMKNLRKELPIAPTAGLFGVYSLPKPGQFVAGVNYQRHKFSGLLKGSDSISAQQAVLEAPNQFFGESGQPSTLRVVPKEAKANVAFPFINYTIDEKISLVSFAPLIEKQSTLETFSGSDPTVSLGTNTVKSKGLGDIKLGVLYKAHVSEDKSSNVIIDAVLSAPTGSITETDVQLAPDGTTPTARLAYGMQLGSGTWDALLGVAYWGKDKEWGWGAQYLATIPLENENSEGWRYDDKHEVTVWSSYEWEPDLVSSFRLRTERQGTIHGIDPNIIGAGLGAQTENYGGKITEASIGVNYMYAPAKNISIEYTAPISQDRNGVQANKDSSIAISWRNAFF
jgi:hypothetical protein